MNPGIVLKDIFIWLYWYPFRRFIQKIPIRYIYSLARILGLIICYLFVQRRRQYENVLVDIFSSKINNKGFKGIVQKAFVVFFMNELEVLVFPKLNADNIEYLVEYSGLEHLNNALAEGKGVMLLFAHFGANQMIMPAIGYRGYKMCQLSAPPTVWVEKMPNKKFSLMAKKGLEIRWEHELSLPVRHINIFGSLKDAFLCLKRNDVLGIAMDGGGGKARVMVDFLGRKAMFSTGAFEIALRTGCAVLPTFMIRYQDGRNRMIIEEPLKIENKPDEDHVKKYASAFVRRFEEYVYRYPCHYLNFLALRTFMEKQGDTPFFVKEDEHESAVDQAAVSQA